MHPRMVECAECDVAYADPVIATDGLSSAYDAAAFDSKQEAVHASRTYAALIEGLLPRLPGARSAVDIGTGEGSFLQELRALGFAEVRGFEPSLAAIEAASQDVRPLITHDVFRSESVGSQRFDLATCFQTVEHLADPAALCSDVHQLLTDGGALVLVCHNRRAPLNRMLGRYSPILDIEHLQLFSPKSAARMLQRAGFVDVATRRIVNRYPLHYWLKLTPLPRAPKRALVSAAGRGRLRGVTLALPVGNFAVVGFRRD